MLTTFLLYTCEQKKQSRLIQNFANVFQSTYPHIPNDMDGLLEPSISESKNARLSSVPNADEVKKVV
jgi:hypothetical protein